LILDFQALALLQDLSILDALLMRSGELERGRALEPFFVEDAPTSNANFQPGVNAAIAIEGLYGSLTNCVDVPTQSEVENDRLALAIWRQMWPSLRREFSFVTGASAQRSATGAEWMLRFSNRVAHPVVLSGGLQALLDDLPASGLTPLRRFLCRYAVEANEPRQIGAPLAALHVAPAKNFAERLRAVRAITDETPLPRLSRDLVSNELEHANQPDALLTVVKEFGGQPIDIDPKIAVGMAAAMDAESLISLLNRTAGSRTDLLGGRIFEAVVLGCEPSTLAAAVQGSTRAMMVQLRPDLLKHIHFWPDSDHACAALVSGYQGKENLSFAWTLLGRRIGPQTATALLHQRWVPSNIQLLKLLGEVQNGAAKPISDYVLSQPDLSEFVLKKAELETLEHLANAQILSSRLPATPASWCAAACRFDGLALSSSLRVIGYAASMTIGGGHGLAAAQQLYDPLQRAARLYRLSRDQENYLQVAIEGKVRGWGLADRLTRAALAKWPVHQAEAGALKLSVEYPHLRDLVDAAFERLGRSGLRDALSDPKLPSPVKTYVISKLKSKPRKSWWF
jgi:hypothetical protein